MSDSVSISLALLAAARKGDARSVRRLLHEGADPCFRNVLSGYTALHDAVDSGDLEVVRLLVEAGAAITDRRNTVFQSALAGAVIAGKAEIVAYLLSAGADPHERLYGDNATLLGEAERNGDRDVADLLRRAVQTGNHNEQPPCRGAAE